MSETEPSEPTKPAGCANCGWTEIERFCPHCGQENVPSALPIREIVLSFLDEFLKFDTKLWITLKALVTKPGFLTTEYLVGRRVRYVAPIKLFLALSFVTFLVFALFPEVEKASDSGGELTGFSQGYRLASSLVPAGANKSSESEEPPARPTATPSLDPDEDADAKQERREAAAKAKHDEACSDVAQTVAEKELKRRDAIRRDAWVSANRSTLNLLRIPLYALLLLFLFRKDTKRLYVEHLVFALHYQSFDQLRDIVSTTLRPVPMLGTALTLYGLWYFVRAASAVYGLPIKRLIGLMFGFLILATAVTAITGFTAGIVYRLTG
jgi:hypothetical protein